MSLNRVNDVASAIIRVKIGNATVQERELLMAWLDESEENRSLYLDIIRGTAIRDRLQFEREMDSVMDYEVLKSDIVKTLQRRRRRKGVLALGITGASAACLALALVLIQMLPFSGKNGPQLPSGNQTYEYNAAQGNVQLILPSGKRFDVDSQEFEISRLIGASVPELTSGTGAGKEETAQEGELYKVVSFREGQASFILDDGTRVFLNAMSQIEFPSSFGDSRREVHLRGEAYFDVAPDVDRPFVVVAEGISVEALGTSFNIQSYADEPEIEATLITGKVKVTAGGSPEGVILEPGMQSVWDRRALTMTVSQADPEEVTAWRTGEFLFNEKPIDYVTRMLCRWYDVEFVYPAENLGRHTFTGKFEKEQKLEEILEMITLSGGPQFEAEGRRIYVIEK